ncbi:uncharacterized protein F5147DRAFT_693123 [Suillus discolor]|uniref:Uncharacterized protein n=1 Tax=Suillus discolor TaxID=1912936 RepID=A0A9P7JUR7_9AGAM|nr:uncharacterized protein F5147DRAFT_693123 [Suillus discolor]KAG2109389.1 hypothetical protein F5147DRAFT_693123 [Suillus discolor]
MAWPAKARNLKNLVIMISWKASLLYFQSLCMSRSHASCLEVTETSSMHLPRWQDHLQILNRDELDTRLEQG